MTFKKPSQNEEEYIAQSNALVRHKKAVEKARQMAAEEREQLRRLHHMKCPKCGMDLEATLFRGVTVDRCYNCNGTWLDAGELERLAGASPDVLGQLSEFFR